jgi:hypothetical protein
MRGVGDACIASKETKLTHGFERAQIATDFGMVGTLDMTENAV